ncbi:MAG: serine protease [Rhizonema sp. PD37]|nr:serine protease [Rhizonema sp. PD37]
MDWRKIVLVACIGCLSISSAVSAPLLKVSVKHPSTQHSPEQLQHLAKLIAVKVLSKNFLGTGILIHKQGSVYTVLTNAHVLRSGHAPYQIQTPDGRIYTAELPGKSDRSGRSYFNGNDLALLQFHSPDISYTVASFGSASTLNVGNEVFAAGFPFDPEENQDKGFVFKAGQVSLMLKKALEGGYQIGYTNDIQKGMSGGPLLNHAGEVVAINGMHAEPLWGDPYVYQDGTEPEQLIKKQMSQYSWGIPIETFVKMRSR